jgi:exonuclease SbcC
VAELAVAHEAARSELAAVLRTVAVPDVDGLHAALGRADAEREAAVAAVAAAEAAAADAARIDAVRAVLDPFVADLKVLAVALRDTNFMSHLVRARESELLAEATRRLRDITAGRFGFTAGFGVVNVASGEVRTPDTLSGGERFQAALALALGLVEIASRGGGRLDAVFVDEGFGSLDSGALDTALDALGKVAGGGKMVALISHLRPVAEYVDTVLHVTRDDVLGSRIDVLDSEAREQLLADDIRSGLTA